MGHKYPLMALALVLMSCSGVVLAEKVMRPKLNEIKLWSDNKFLTHSVTFDPSDPHLNLSLNVLQEIPDADIKIEAKIIQKADPSYFFEMNTTINLCRLLNWRSKSPIGSLIYAYLKEYGTPLETCPIAKGHYYMHKYWIPEDSTSGTFPEVNFELHFTALTIDANKERTIVIDDHFSGEGVIQEVSKVKSGILALLPKAG